MKNLIDGQQADQRHPYKIAVDFDGTVVLHEYPAVGADVPQATEWLRRLVQDEAAIILNTMRSGEPLAEAVAWFEARGIPLYGVNHDPDQDEWTQSPKVYAHVYVDDAALGCPLVYRRGGRSFVDWNKVGPSLLAMAVAHGMEAEA